MGTASGRLAERALAICENRVELLLVELQEERDQMLRAFWLGLVVGISGLMAGVAVSVAIAIACWPWSPLGAMLILTALYASLAFIFNAKLARLRRDWTTLPATLDELKKDRECLARHLS